eukprot:189507-Rhodomonas_salina.2
MASRRLSWSSESMSCVTWMSTAAMGRLALTEPLLHSFSFTIAETGCSKGGASCCWLACASDVHRTHRSVRDPSLCNTFWSERNACSFQFSSAVTSESPPRPSSTAKGKPGTVSPSS